MSEEECAKPPGTDFLSQLPCKLYPFVSEADFRRQFVFVRPLGHGDVGRVFLCRRLPDLRHVVLKVYWKKELYSRGKVRRVYNEYTVLTSVSHPHLLPMEAFFQTLTKVVFVLPFIRGGELFFVTQCQPSKTLQPQAVRGIAAQVALGLRALHAAGVFYRDLKPENVLMTRNGHVVICDFDLVSQRKDPRPTFVGSMPVGSGLRNSCSGLSTDTYIRFLSAVPTHFPVMSTNSPGDSLPSSSSSGVAAHTLPLAGASRCTTRDYESLVPLHSTGLPGPSIRSEMVAPCGLSLALQDRTCASRSEGAPCSRRENPFYTCASEEWSSSSTRIPATQPVTHEFKNPLPVIRGNPGRLSVVGTREYMAPEVVAGRGHDHGVDFWSLGVLVYELLIGRSPFAAADPKQIASNIIRGSFEWPSQYEHSETHDSVQSAARDFVNRLIVPDPSRRMGMGPDGWAQVFKHPFFEGVNWDAVTQSPGILCLDRAFLRPVGTILRCAPPGTPLTAQELFQEPELRSSQEASASRIGSSDLSGSPVRQDLSPSGEPGFYGGDRHIPPAGDVGTAAIFAALRPVVFAAGYPILASLYPDCLRGIAAEDACHTHDSLGSIPTTRDGRPCFPGTNLSNNRIGTMVSEHGSAHSFVQDVPDVSPLSRGCRVFIARGGGMLTPTQRGPNGCHPTSAGAKQMVFQRSLVTRAELCKGKRLSAGADSVSITPLGAPDAADVSQTCGGRVSRDIAVSNPIICGNPIHPRLSACIPGIEDTTVPVEADYPAPSGTMEPLITASLPERDALCTRSTCETTTVSTCSATAPSTSPGEPLAVCFENVPNQRQEAAADLCSHAPPPQDHVDYRSILTAPSGTEAVLHCAVPLREVPPATVLSWNQHGRARASQAHQTQKRLHAPTHSPASDG
eukprot:TRINITY_DN44218_c0_g1_i1.p1 TRINITY_DN44218_c0_g1~~TRINITY_DN44218_c0_g1_i1.p1  ORF type:complete len:933 (-),score=-30.82 TRINITY_DN44218_c0_g1_i1:126-2846(-)